MPQPLTLRLILNTADLTYCSSVAVRHAACVDFELCDDDLSPAKLVIVMVRFEAGACGACSATAAEPCSHSQFEHIELGAVSVQASMLGMLGQCPFLHNWAQISPEHQLLSEAGTLSAVTVTDTELFHSEWAGEPDAFAVFRLMFDMTLLSTGIVFKHVWSQLYLPACLEIYPKLELAELEADTSRECDGPVVGSCG